MGYGIYSTVSKKFFKGIDEPTKEEAFKKLRKIIGDDARKWRWEARPVSGSKIGNKLKEVH